MARTVTFRGRMSTNVEQVIRISRNDGLTGYRIKKFQLLPKKPISENATWLFQIFTVKQLTHPQDETNFDNPTLMAAATFTQSSNPTDFPEDTNIIFDDKVVNQDIFIYSHRQNGSSCNYYLELEEVSLNLNEATVATLKDMRGRQKIK